MVWRGRRRLARGLSMGALFVGFGWLSSCAGRSVETPPGADATGGTTGGSGGAGGTAGGRASGGRVGAAGRGGGTSGKGGSGGAAGRGTGGTGGTGAGGRMTASSGRAGGGAGGDAGNGAVPGEAGVSGDAGETGQGGAPDTFVPLRCTPAGTYASDLLRCDEDFVHRAEAGACAAPARDTPDTPVAPRRNDDEYSRVIVDCQLDVDCNDGAYCLRRESFLDDEVTYVCIAPCSTDADCGDGRICVCDAFSIKGSTLAPITLGRCAAATCVTDDDCDAGALCAASLYDDCGYGVTRALEFHCQSSADECNGPSDCFGYAECAHDGSRFACDDCSD